MTLPHRQLSPARALLTATLLVCAAAGGDLARSPTSVVGVAGRSATAEPMSIAGASPTWNVKTHVFAANMVLADVQRDGKVTIPPFGEFAVNAELVRALQLHPDDYRSGVVGPDVFPDIFVGQSFAHVDHWCDRNHWIADYWLRQVFNAARSSTDPEDLRLRRLAFAYGFLTHGAQDMFGHTFINHYVGAKWGSVPPAESLKFDVKHVVLEAYVAKHTPPSDLSINVDDRFQAEELIKPPVIRAHTLDAPHYQSWLRMYDWLGRSIQQTYNALGQDTSTTNCYSSTSNWKNCEELFYMIGWRADIDRGLRHLVDANHELGEAILAGNVRPGIDALMEWKSEWLPKMYGLHALGEFDAQMEDFSDWWKSVNPLAPIDSIISKAVMEQVENFLAHNFGPQYAYFQMILNPSNALDSAFLRSTVDSIRADMHMGAGPDSLVNWNQFDALYNTVIASKLVLLDGDGLNELARRAGLTTPLYGSGPAFNIMIGVMRSMDGDHQWDTLGDWKRPYGLPLSRPKVSKQVAGMSSTAIARSPQLAGHAGSNQPRTACQGTQPPPEYLDSTGYAFFQADSAREKIFQHIFRGWGPPGAPVPSVSIGLPLGRLQPVRYDALASDLDTLQRDVASLAARRQMTVDLAPTRLAALQHPPRGTAPRWGALCCRAGAQSLRSALASFEADAHAAARTAGRNRDARAAQILVRMLTQTATIDTQVSSLLEAADAAAAQHALQQVSAGVGTLATLVAEARR